MNYLFFLTCYFLIWLGVLDFGLWPQVIELYNFEAGLELLLTHPHGLRYALVLPFFTVGNWLDIDYNIVFTLFSPLLLITVPIFLTKVVFFYKKNIQINDKRALFAFFSLTIILISIFMNGRLLFALSGFSMLTYCLIYWDLIPKRKNVGLLFLSVLFMSVSSGTFILGIVVIVFTALYSFYKIPTRSGVTIILLGLLGFSFLLPLIDMLFMKNVNYYGSIYLMLSHGYGVVIGTMDDEVFWLLLFIILELIFVQIFFIHLYRKYIPLLFIFLAPISIGVFGHSVLSLALIPFLVLLSVIIFSVKKTS